MFYNSTLASVHKYLRIRDLYKELAFENLMRRQVHWGIRNNGTKSPVKPLAQLRFTTLLQNYYFCNTGANLFLSGCVRFDERQALPSSELQ